MRGELLVEQEADVIVAGLPGILVVEDPMGAQ
jgi:hypothetical protein